MREPKHQKDPLIENNARIVRANFFTPESALEIHENVHTRVKVQMASKIKIGGINLALPESPTAQVRKVRTIPPPHGTFFSALDKVMVFRNRGVGIVSRRR